MDRNERSTFALAAPFWHRFVEHHWEQAPLVMKRPFPDLIIRPEELFEGLVAAADLHRASRNVPRRTGLVRFSVDHAAIITDVERYLPSRDDGSVSGYFHRLDRCLDGRPFELIVNELQEHSLPLWNRLRTLLGGLYRLVGLPTKNAEVAVFLRRQVATSFGVHRDDASVFLFVLEGRKRILAWRPEVFGARNVTSSLDYAQLRDQAEVLEGEAGDMLYWPSSHWHVGEADGGPSVSVNLGLHLQAHPTAELMTTALSLIQTRRSPAAGAYPFQPDHLEASARTLPPPLQELTETLRQASLDGSLQRSVHRAWLNRVTGFGFTRCPPPLPVRPVRDHERVQAPRPIVSIPWTDAKIACSANGHSFSVTATPGVVQLIEQLNSGASEDAGRLVARCAGTDADEEAFLREVLARLLALRAVVSLPPRDEAYGGG